MSKNKNKPVKELYRQSETKVIFRSEINFAPYNPKRHSADQIKQITRNFKRVAYLGGIIVNATTMNLIDGHKRLMAMDAIHAYDGDELSDYEVKVEMIEVDEKTEREQNIFQTKSRTDLDSELLAALVVDVDVKNTGLTDDDIALLEFEVPDFNFAEDKELADDIERIDNDIKQKRHEQIHKKTAGRFGRNTDADDEDTEESYGEEDEEDLPETKHTSNARKSDAEREADRLQRIEKIKEAKRSQVKGTEGEPFVTLTFSNFEEKAWFMEQFGYDAHQKFIKGERFAEKIDEMTGTILETTDEDGEEIDIDDDL